jgi:hypothetical protein
MGLWLKIYGSNLLIILKGCVNMKNKLFSVIITLVLVISMVFAVGYTTENQPASKATAKVANLTLLDWVSSDTTKTVEWTPLLSQTIKTSQQKDLFVDASFECGLYTNTLVKSRDMVSDTSNATAGIEVRVLVDGKEAFPGSVVFARRSQELSATLQGQLALMDKDGDGVVDFDELVTIAPEEISLVLETLNANSFNFILPDVTVGTHTVEVQARINLGTKVQAGKAEAKALIGKGSVTVEEVRMIKDTAIVEEM